MRSGFVEPRPKRTIGPGPDHSPALGRACPRWDATAPSGPTIIRTPLGRHLPGPLGTFPGLDGQPGPGLPLRGTSGRPAGPSGIAARAQPEGALDRTPPGPGAWRRAVSGSGEPAGRCSDWLSLENLDPRSKCGRVPSRSLVERPRPMLCRLIRIPTQDRWDGGLGSSSAPSSAVTCWNWSTTAIDSQQAPRRIRSYVSVPRPKTTLDSGEGNHRVRHGEDRSDAEWPSVAKPTTTVGTAKSPRWCAGRTCWLGYAARPIIPAQLPKPRGATGFNGAEIMSNYSPRSPKTPQSLATTHR